MVIGVDSILCVFLVFFSVTTFMKIEGYSWILSFAFGLLATGCEIALLYFLMTYLFYELM